MKRVESNCVEQRGRRRINELQRVYPMTFSDPLDKYRYRVADETERLSAIAPDERNPDLLIVSVEYSQVRTNLADSGTAILRDVQAPLGN